MFSALRQNAPLYILDKNNQLSLKVASVESVSSPVPKFQNNFQVGQYNMETVVDITAKSGDDTVRFDKIPSNLSIANFGSVTISESPDAMLTELDTIVKKSQEVIKSVPYHESVLKEADSIARTLNPRLNKEREQEEKINLLETKMSGIENVLEDVKGMLSEALKR